MTQENIIQFLYNKPLGQYLLKYLISPPVSRMAGSILDTSFSRVIIPEFIRRNQIDMTQYEEQRYVSYNDFFTRRVKASCRPIDREAEHLIAPCDAKLSVYPIKKGSAFVVKDTSYTMHQLCRNRRIAEHYEGGILLLFRLTVDDYHRYCYPDDGMKSDNYHISGVFHTVNPIANDHESIYKENTREFCLLKSRNFGTMLIMEVGAMMVGRIVNYHHRAEVKRGQEKGRFEFGGSTVIMCVKDKDLQIRSDIIENTNNGIETVVKMGEVIGTK